MHKNNNGFVLIGILLLLSVASVLALSGSNELIQHTKIIANQKDYIQCFYKADGAIMHFRKMLAETSGFNIESKTLNIDGAVLEITREQNSLVAIASCNEGYSGIQAAVNDLSQDEAQVQWTAH